jgi:multisubunit Na+/H+ antiporter MnhB subunit
LSTTSLLILDGLLLISMVSLAWAALTSSDERRCVILFMAFGLVLALAWARLLAPDVALAEAAIGAGLSGGLLLTAVREPPQSAPTGRTDSVDNRHGSRMGLTLHWVVTTLSAALAVTLAWALGHAFSHGPQDSLAQAVSANLAASGVGNPVTAVLLNFRAYDTLLELAVLLTALLGIFALGRARPGYLAAGPVFDGLARWLVPVLILAAGYLLWVGAHAPGGAFQAGATLAAAGVVLRLAGRPDIGLPHGIALRIAMAAGVGIFLLVGLGLLLLGRPFLGYPPAWAGALILMIESAAMVAIAATLMLAFLGGRPESFGLQAVHEGPAAPPVVVPRSEAPEAMSRAEFETPEARDRFTKEENRC